MCIVPYLLRFLLFAFLSCNIDGLGLLAISTGCSLLHYKKKRKKISQLGRRYQINLDTRIQECQLRMFSTPKDSCLMERRVIGNKMSDVMFINNTKWFFTLVVRWINRKTVLIIFQSSIIRILFSVSLQFY